MNLSYFKLIDTSTPGQRCDVTPLFAHIAAFAELVKDLSQPFLRLPVDFVAGIDALGFILGTAMALHLQKGFIPVRKGGKLPGEKISVAFTDYTGDNKVLELRAGAIPAGSRVLVVDEWIETGAQVSAAAQLIENQGGVIIEIAAINIDDNPNTQWLKGRYFCHSIANDL